MQPRTRMFITLGALALAMTACAILLAWIEPRTPVASAPTDPAYILDRASEAVDQVLDRSIPPPRDIRIVTAGPFGEGPAPLAATRHPSPGSPHFIVSEDGMVYVASRWRGQGPKAPGDTPIVIALSGGIGAEVLPPAQWSGLRALLLAVRTRLETETGESAMLVRPILNLQSSGTAQTLRELLGIEGFMVPAP